MSLINVPVLWDGKDNFFNGAVYTINASSSVIGVYPKLSQPQIPSFPKDILYVDTVRVIVNPYTEFYVNLSLNAYYALVGASSVPVGRNGYVISGVIGTTGFPDGTVYQSNDLIGATLTLIVLNGVVVPLSSVSFDQITGTIEFNDNVLVDDDTLQVNYYL